MSDISGFSELYSLIEDLEINEGQEQRILKEASKQMKNIYEEASPVRTGYIKSSIKAGVRNGEEGKEAYVKVTAWDALFGKIICRAN